MTPILLILSIPLYRTACYYAYRRANEPYLKAHSLANADAQQWTILVVLALILYILSLVRP